MSGELAGRLSERVTIERDGEVVGTAWAALAPAGIQARAEGDALSAMPRWRVTLRPRDVRVGDRIGWRGLVLLLVAVEADPAVPDRIVATAEELRT